MERWDHHHAFATMRSPRMHEIIAMAAKKEFTGVGNLTSTEGNLVAVIADEVGPTPATLDRDWAREVADGMASPVHAAPAGHHHGILASGRRERGHPQEDEFPRCGRK